MINLLSAVIVFLILVLALMASTDDPKPEQKKEW